ncbi:MAG: cytochrome c-type biogenesis protein [Arenimonas sp.]
MKKIIFLALFFFSHTLLAIDPTDYRSTEEEQRFRSLAAELRCVMCQNQSLADSNAMIAKDLRLELLSLIREGKSDEEIKQFMVSRYTDFVLYKPPVRPNTWLLWFGPLLVLVFGALSIFVIVKKRSAAMPAANIQNNHTQDDSEQEW